MHTHRQQKEWMESFYVSGRLHSIGKEWRMVGLLFLYRTRKASWVCTLTFWNLNVIFPRAIETLGILVFYLEVSPSSGLIPFDLGYDEERRRWYKVRVERGQIMWPSQAVGRNLEFI